MLKISQFLFNYLLKSADPPNLLSYFFITSTHSHYDYTGSLA